MVELTQKHDEPGKKLTPAQAAKKLEAQKEKDRELVTGIFEYKEKQGQTLKFFYRKYDDDEYKEYHLQDGQRYRIPRMVARHLNQNCYYVEYKRLGGALASTGIHEAGSGNESTYANMYGVNKIHRASFRSLEFMDEDISASNLTEVVYL